MTNYSMRIRPVEIVGAGIVAILILAGCAGIGKPLETPRISLSNIQMLEGKGLEATFHVRLRVTNPNDVDLDIKGVDCDLEINGKPFAYGISNDQVTVPAYGSETITVTVYSSVLDIVKGLFALPQREDLSYGLKGKLRLSGTGLMPSAFPFDAQGSVSIKDFSPGRRGPS